LKKNRRVLDTTEEEEDVVSGGSGSGSTSGSPPDTVDVDSVLTSPRREMRRRVRQISQGVEDINWQGPHDTSSDKESEEELDLDDVVASTIVEVPNGNVAVHEAQGKDEESRPKTPEDSVRSAPDIRNLNPDALIQSPVRNGPIEDSGRLRAFSESNEKGLKRKFLERGTSQGPSEESPTEPLKRPRDDADKDDNPREAKRLSPPPSPPRPSSSPKGSKPVSFLSISLQFFSSRSLESRADS
jgi:Ran-binding protein 3